MKTYIDTKLKNLGEKRFYIYGPLTSLTADLILIYYATYILLPQLVTNKLLKVVLQLQYGLGAAPPPDSLQMIRGVLTIATGIMLSGFFLFNCIVAYNCYRRSKGSLFYLKGYTLSAVVLSVFELGTYMVKLKQFNFYTFLTLVLYFLVYYGLKYFEKNQPKST